MLIRLLALEKRDNDAIERVKAAYLTSGWRGVVTERIRIVEGDEDPNYMMLAEWYAYLGNKDKAFEWLEKAYQRRYHLLPFIRWNPTTLTHCATILGLRILRGELKVKNSN